MPGPRSMAKGGSTEAAPLVAGVAALEEALARKEAELAEKRQLASEAAAALAASEAEVKAIAMQKLLALMEETPGLATGNGELSDEQAGEVGPLLSLVLPDLPVYKLGAFGGLLKKLDRTVAARQ